MRTGLERLLDEPQRWVGKARVGLVANPTTVDRHLTHGADLMHRHPDIDLRLLFGPEHGIRGAAQDMVGVGDARDPVTGLPEVSLYGKTFESLSPTRGAPVADRRPRLRHPGHRRALLHLRRHHGAVHAGGAVGGREGRRARSAEPDRRCANRRRWSRPGTARTSAACIPFPQRHGLTIGELARLYNDTFGIGCELEVVACEGWRREQYYDECDLPWVMPSPNMPTLDTAIVYPGMCLLEGTNLSEGRGTTRPFELFGAPFIDGRALAASYADPISRACGFRPCTIEPTFHKFAGQRCGAVQLHVTDRRAFQSYRTGLAVLVAVKRLWPEAFAWRTEPYEFRDDVPAIDLLTGRPAARAAIAPGADLNTVMQVACTGPTPTTQDGARRCCTTDFHPAVTLIPVTPLASMACPRWRSQSCRPCG